MLGSQVVFNEVAGSGKPGAQSLQNADWLRRVRASPVPDPLLIVELDAGEAEVISLARQLSSAWRSSTSAAKIGARPRFAEKRGTPVTRFSRTCYPNTLRLLTPSHDRMPRNAETFTSSAALSNPSSSV